MHNERNRKLGGSVRAGYAAATKDLVLYTDADLPFDLQELGRAVRLLEYQEADVLAAYRFDRTSEGLVRTVYSLRLQPRSSAPLFGLAVKDVNFSFKLFRRSLLERIALKSEGSFIDAEFLIRARKAGASIIQIGVDYFPRSRGISTLSSPGVILTILREMVAAPARAAVVKALALYRGLPAPVAAAHARPRLHLPHARPGRGARPRRGAAARGRAAATVSSPTRRPWPTPALDVLGVDPSTPGRSAWAATTVAVAAQRPLPRRGPRRTWPSGTSTPWP